MIAMMAPIIDTFNFTINPFAVIVRIWLIAALFIIIMTTFVGGIAHWAFSQIHHAYISIQSRHDGATKRLKVSSETAQVARPWTSSHDIMELASSSVGFRTMVENMRSVSRRYKNSPAMSKILKPFAHTLKQVPGYDGDLAITFYKQTQILLNFLDSTYDANKIARLREANEFVPINTIALAGAPEKLLALTSSLLKTPEMPYVFKNLLELNCQQNIRMPLYFIARVHSDLDAFVEKQPLPSYYKDFPPYMADVLQPAITSSLASANRKPEPVADEDCVATYVSPFDDAALASATDTPESATDEDCVVAHTSSLDPSSVASATDMPELVTDEDCVLTHMSSLDSFSMASANRKPEPVLDEDCVKTHTSPLTPSSMASAYRMPESVFGKERVKTYTSPHTSSSSARANRKPAAVTGKDRAVTFTTPLTSSSARANRKPEPAIDEGRVMASPITETLESLEASERAANLGIMPLVVRSATRLLTDYHDIVPVESERLNLEYNTMINMLDSTLVISERGRKRLEEYMDDRQVADSATHDVGELLDLLQDMKKEEKDLRSRQEHYFETSGFRAPKKQFIDLLPVAKSNSARDTIYTDPGTTISTDVRGTPLKTHDFKTLVPETAWLNDEIVNSTFGYLDRAINTAAGITDPKKQTRKCYSVSSLFISRLEADAKAGISSLRRQGITKANLLDVDTILLPICSRSHWTLLAILPSRRIITHIDPMLSVSDQKRITLAEGLLHAVLEERWMREEWRVETIPAPRQTNGYDCGVFTITNGMCLALGLNPAVAYTAGEMREQRLRLAATLLNKGFTGDFDLSVF